MKEIQNFDEIWLFYISSLEASKINVIKDTTILAKPPMTPVPSVCVRVPHSPSIDSGKSDSPNSPRNKIYAFDYPTLAVRECDDIHPKCMIFEIYISALFLNFFSPFFSQSIYFNIKFFLFILKQNIIIIDIDNYVMMINTILKDAALCLFCHI